MLKGFINFFKDLITDRKVIYELAKNDFKAKYTNSLLGIAWAFMLPLTIILVLCGWEGQIGTTTLSCP